MPVLDSSAMIAYLNKEKGGDIIKIWVEAGDVALYVHAINLCEVFYDALRDKSHAAAERAIAILKADGIIERNDMDGAFWRDIAYLINARRTQSPPPDNPKLKPRLALGDACGRALARRLNDEFVTADRTEIEPLQNAGLVKVAFIR